MSATDLSAVACCKPLADPTLSDEEAAWTAALFKALADPARVKIVNRLARSERPVCACDLEPALQLAQPTVSHHLKRLTDAGLLEREQHGKWAYFTINRAAAETLATVVDLHVEPEGRERADNVGPTRERPGRDGAEKGERR